MKLKRTTVKFIQVTMLVLCLIFAFILFLEFNIDYTLHSDGKNIKASNKSVLYSRRANNGMPPITDYEIIVDRPLFSEERQPYLPVTGNMHGLNTVDSGKLDQSLADNYLLAAIIISDDTRIALLEPKRGKPVWLGIGDTVDGWKLANVDAHSIMLVRGTEKTNLQLEVVKSPVKTVHMIREKKNLQYRNVQDNNRNIIAPSMDGGKADR